MKALSKVAHLSTSTLWYATIKQAPQEPFMQFIECLRDAMENQVADDYAKNLLILQLARDNTNDECTKAIDLLPKENPTLEEMINTCAKVGNVSHQITMLAESIATVAKVTHHCSRCRQQGHGKTDCPRNKQALKNPAEKCKRCGEPGHLAQQCKSTFHANGHPLREQGNRRTSATGKCAQTQIFSERARPTEAYATSSLEGHEDQPAWMFPPSTQ